MRNNLDSDVTKSYRMNAQFMFVNANDIYRDKTYYLIKRIS